MRTTINKPLLRKVRDIILKRPSQFVMWALYSGDNEVGEDPGFCNTAACIAGWATCLHKRIKPSTAIRKTGNFNAWEEGRKALGLDDHEARALFDVAGWPNTFYHPFCNATTMKTKSKVAAARINHFLKTGK